MRLQTSPKQIGVACLCIFNNLTNARVCVTNSSLQFTLQIFKPYILNSHPMGIAEPSRLPLYELVKTFMDFHIIWLEHNLL